MCCGKKDKKLVPVEICSVLSLPVLIVFFSFFFFFLLFSRCSVIVSGVSN